MLLLIQLFFTLCDLGFGSLRRSTGCFHAVVRDLCGS